MCLAFKGTVTTIRSLRFLPRANDITALFTFLLSLLASLRFNIDVCMKIHFFLSSFV